MRYTFLLLGIFSWFIFLLFQAQGIYTGDSGDLVTAAYLFGVPHPPGYPLYTLLGFLLSKLPLLTASWRITLVSSLSHAAVVALVAWLVTRLTGKLWAGIFASMVLLGNYLFFLYSVTSEVFALLDLFVILLIVFAYQWYVTRQAKYLYAMSFTLGLSLSHHHVIVFLLPALAYLVWQNRKQIIDTGEHKKLIAYCLLLVALGLLPYLYLPMAARTDAIINWDRPVDWPSFWRLVTRADYGSFVSSGGYGRLLLQRLLQIKAFGEFILVDYSWVGVILALAGLAWLLRQKSKLFARFFLLALVLLGPAFLFYASFPLINRFALGTYERFLLPSYLLLSVLVGLGVFGVVTALCGWLRSRIKLRQSMIFEKAVIGVLFLYPIFLIAITGFRFWGLRTDHTAEYMAQDILATIAPDGILLLVSDTPLFTTQYARYVLGMRPDVAVIHASRLSAPDYRIVLQKNFPDLSFPDVTREQFSRAFTADNARARLVFANAVLPVGEGWFWVSEGLLYRLAKQEKLPSVEETLRINENLWQRYHDPRSGILSRYPHLMLADVVDTYAGSRVALGKVLLRAGKYDEAREQLMKAADLGGDTYAVDALTLLGITELFLKHCDEALGAFAQARKLSPHADPSVALYEAVTWHDCAGDEKRAAELFAEYEKLRREMELPLEKL